MPLYEYECVNDGTFELVRKFSDPPLTECPKCGGPVEKLASAPAIQFKGTGWYITDYARKPGGGGSGKDRSGGAESGGGDSGKDRSGGGDSGKDKSDKDKSGSEKSGNERSRTEKGAGAKEPTGGTSTTPSSGNTAKTGSDKK